MRRDCLIVRRAQSAKSRCLHVSDHIAIYMYICITQPVQLTRHNISPFFGIVALAISLGVMKTTHRLLQNKTPQLTLWTNSLIQLFTARQSLAVSSGFSLPLLLGVFVRLSSASLTHTPHTCTHTHRNLRIVRPSFPLLLHTSAGVHYFF